MTDSSVAFREMVGGLFGLSSTGESKNSRVPPGPTGLGEGSVGCGNDPSDGEPQSSTGGSASTNTLLDTTDLKGEQTDGLPSVARSNNDNGNTVLTTGVPSDFNSGASASVTTLGDTEAQSTNNNRDSGCSDTHRPRSPSGSTHFCHDASNSGLPGECVGSGRKPGVLASVCCVLRVV